MENKAEFFIEDAFDIKGRGVVATGKVMKGVVKVGMKGSVLDKEITVKSIERFRDILTEAKEGDDVGLILENADYDELKSQVNNVLIFS